jgi:hypothetical protein
MSELFWEALRRYMSSDAQWEALLKRTRARGKTLGVRSEAEELEEKLILKFEVTPQDAAAIWERTVARHRRREAQTRVARYEKTTPTPFACWSARPKERATGTC